MSCVTGTKSFTTCACAPIAIAAAMTAASLRFLIMAGKPNCIANRVIESLDSGGRDAKRSSVFDCGCGFAGNGRDGAGAGHLSAGWEHEPVDDRYHLSLVRRDLLCGSRS